MTNMECKYCHKEMKLWKQCNGRKQYICRNCFAMFKEGKRKQSDAWFTGWMR